jgi:hypothetical protein
MAHMHEKQPDSSSESQERFSESEILHLLQPFLLREYRISKKLERDGSLYMLEVVTEDASGDKVIYTYMREGSLQTNTFSEPTIDVVYYSGDTPIGGTSLLPYNLIQ